MRRQNLETHIQIKCLVNSCYFTGKGANEIYSHVLKHVPTSTKVPPPMLKCFQLFINQSSFRSHFFRKHSSVKSGTSKRECTRNIVSLAQAGQVNSQKICNGTLGNKNNMSVNSFENILSKLRCEFNVSEICINFVLKEFLRICSDNANFNILRVRETFSSSEVLEKEGEVVKLLQSSILKKDLSRNLTVRSQNKCFSEKKYFVSPKEIYLGVDNYHKKCVFHYIPLLESLQSLFNDDKFFKIFCQSKESEHKTYIDYNDGLVYKNQSFFHYKNKCIELLIFQDAFELCNPLGSFKKKHKLIGFYNIVGNIDAKYRSVIQNIQLILLCKESHIKTFDFDAILSPLTL